MPAKKRKHEELNNQETKNAKKLKVIIAAEKQEAAAIEQKEKKEAEERKKRDAAAKRELAKRAREEAEEARKKARTQEPAINTDTSTSSAPVLNVPPVNINVGQAIQHLTNQVHTQPILVAPAVQNGCGGGGQPPVNPFIPGFAANLQNLGNNNLNPNGGLGNLNNQQQPSANNQAPQPPATANNNQVPPVALQPPVVPAAANTLFDILLGTGIKKAVAGAATTVLTTGFGAAVTYMFGDSNEGTNKAKLRSRTLSIGGEDNPVPVKETKPTVCSRENLQAGLCN